MRASDEYDDGGRLERTVRDGVVTAVYSYGPNGNRAAHSTTGGIVIGSYDDQDRLLQYCPRDMGGALQPITGLPCFEYSYRTSGQLLTKLNVATGLSTNYDYDELGALRRVTLEDTRVVDYEIDASGRRVGKRVNGVKQWGLLYRDNLRPIAKLAANGAVEAVFVYATKQNVPDFMVTSSATYRFLSDQLGSSSAVL